MPRVNDTINIGNARILFRNFEGRPDKYNKDGKRGFCVIIDDPERAEQLAEDGWNVRILKPRDEDEVPRHYIPVAVSYKIAPPKIYMIAGKKKVLLDEETVGQLDYADIRNVDLIIRPYNWEMSDKNGVSSGVKAYLKTMYMTVEEDEFAYKYEDDHDRPY